MILNGNVVYYAVKVNGMILEHKYSDKTYAENIKFQVQREQGPAALVEVVPVTADGKELLLG